jgi:hypothetical protein
MPLALSNTPRRQILFSAARVQRATQPRQEAIWGVSRDHFAHNLHSSVFQLSGGRTTQNSTPLLTPSCLGAHT